MYLYIPYKRCIHTYACICTDVLCILNIDASPPSPCITRFRKQRVQSSVFSQPWGAWEKTMGSIKPGKKESNSGKDIPDVLVRPLGRRRCPSIVCIIVCMYAVRGRHVHYLSPNSIYLHPCSSSPLSRLPLSPIDVEGFPIAPPTPPAKTCPDSPKLGLSP